MKNQAETELLIATGRPCKTPYAKYRPFAGELPSDTVRGEEAIRRLNTHARTLSEEKQDS